MIANSAFLAAMVICGMWHGPAFHFTVWGAYHGILLNVYHAYDRWRTRRRGGRIPEPRLATQIVACLFTFHLVAIGWVWFVCDFDRALHVIARLLLLR